MLAEAKKIIKTLEEINQKKVYYAEKFHSIVGIERNETALYITLDDDDNSLIFPINIYDIPNVYENNAIGYDLQLLSVYANSLTKHSEKWDIDITLKQLAVPLD
jgi:hypothetical protein